MKALHIITPVKDSLNTTIETVDAITKSQISVPHSYTIYNDRSTPENTATLAKWAAEKGFRLVNIAEHTDHPSPNYLWVLQTARREALAADAGLAIVESDVVVDPTTLQQLFDGAEQRADCGIAAAVTVDDEGDINYPYDFARKMKRGVIDCKKHCSFCCSLLTPELMRRFDFDTLDASKNWFDVTISHESLSAGLKNYLFTELMVVHRPHGSRPWKQLKYTNPVKYYWFKLTRRRDKI